MKSNLNHINITPFRPAPWCPNGHFHTIGRSLLSFSEKPPHRRVEIPTPDDDFLELDLCENAAAGDDPRPVIALFHGLEGSTDRFYMTELMSLLFGKGWTIVGVNFRGCGSRLNRRRRFYHSGETEDYSTVFRWIGRRFPGRPLGAVGFSLGGNALLKSLGERDGEGDHPVDAAATVSVPYDLALGSRVISEGFNRIYEYRFLRTLRKKLEKKREIYPDLPTFTGRTLYEFDDQVTSQIHGFRDAEDYYERCSSKHFLDRIKTPTLLIHSRADPLCPAAAMPLETIDANRSLSYILTREGGHVGYWSIPPGWLNRTVGTYLEERLVR